MRLRPAPRRRGANTYRGLGEDARDPDRPGIGRLRPEEGPVTEAVLNHEDADQKGGGGTVSGAPTQSHP
jgi:hypothetical protein